MTKESLQNQADRADAIADQTVDEVVKRTLRDAAKEYRGQLRGEVCDPKPDWKLPKEIS